VKYQAQRGVYPPPLRTPLFQNISISVEFVETTKILSFMVHALMFSGL